MDLRLAGSPVSSIQRRLIRLAEACAWEVRSLVIPLVFELSVFIYYIYLMLFADSLSATVLSPVEVTVGVPVPLVG
jgi:hypothetical protein